MNYTLKLAWRPSEFISMDKKHGMIVDSLKQIEGAFGIAEGIDWLPPKFGTYETATTNLTRKLGKGLKGSIMYPYRNCIAFNESVKKILGVNLPVGVLENAE
jgi:hypothetical protein